MNFSKGLRKILAGVFAVMLVSGSVPVGGMLPDISGTPVSASAAEEEGTVMELNAAYLGEYDSFLITPEGCYIIYNTSTNYSGEYTIFYNKADKYVFKGDFSSKGDGPIRFKNPSNEAYTFNAVFDNVKMKKSYTTRNAVAVDFVYGGMYGPNAEMGMGTPYTGDVTLNLECVGENVLEGWNNPAFENSSYQKVTVNLTQAEGSVLSFRDVTNSGSAYQLYKSGYASTDFYIDGYRMLTTGKREFSDNVISYHISSIDDTVTDVNCKRAEGYSQVALTQGVDFDLEFSADGEEWTTNMPTDGGRYQTRLKGIGEFDGIIDTDHVSQSSFYFIYDGNAMVTGTYFNQYESNTHVDLKRVAGGIPLKLESNDYFAVVKYHSDGEKYNENYTATRGENGLYTWTGTLTEDARIICPSHQVNDYIRIGQGVSFAEDEYYADGEQINHFTSYWADLAVSEDGQNFIFPADYAYNGPTLSRKNENSIGLYIKSGVGTLAEPYVFGENVVHHTLANAGRTPVEEYFGVGDVIADGADITFYPDQTLYFRNVGGNYSKSGYVVRGKDEKFYLGNDSIQEELEMGDGYNALLVESPGHVVEYAYLAAERDITISAEKTYDSFALSENDFSIRGNTLAADAFLENAEISYQYFNAVTGEELTEAPVDAGRYYTVLTFTNPVTSESFKLDTEAVISKRDIHGCDLKTDTLTYNGGEQTAVLYYTVRHDGEDVKVYLPIEEFTVKSGWKSLIAGSNGATTVRLTQKDAGTYYSWVLTDENTRNYCGNKNFAWSIEKAALTGNEFTAELPDKVYDALAYDEDILYSTSNTLAFELLNSSTSGKEITYYQNGNPVDEALNAGTYTAMVTFSSKNFEPVEKEISFSISKRNLGNENIQAEPLVYNGQNQTATLFYTITENGMERKVYLSTDDFKAEAGQKNSSQFPQNVSTVLLTQKNAKTYYSWIYAKDSSVNYSGNRNFEWSISPKSLTDVEVLGENLTYNGSAQTTKLYYTEDGETVYLNTSDVRFTPDSDSLTQIEIGGYTAEFEAKTSNYDFEGTKTASWSVEKGEAHDITLNVSGNGTVTADKETASLGETVTLTLSGELQSITVNGEALTPVDGVYSFTMPDEAVTVSAVFEEEEEAAPTVAGHSVILSGEVGIRFYMNLNQLTAAERKAGYMEFIVNGNSKTVAYDKDIKTTIGGETAYGFTCYLTTLEMAEEITAVYHYGDGKTVQETYTMQEYLETAVARTTSAKALAMYKAIADYGHYAQTYLADANHLVIGEDGYAPMEQHYTESYDHDAIKAAAAKYARVVDEGETGFTAGMSLSFNSQNEINIYFYAPKDYKGTFTVTVDGEPATAVKSGTSYKVTIPNIFAHDLGTAHTVVAATDNGTISCKASGLSYVYAVLDSKKSSSYAKDAVCALYEYCNAVIQYRK